MIKVHLQTTKELPTACADFIYQQLLAFLTEGPTLLLVSGGSVATEVLPILAKLLAPASFENQLTLGLLDERFGSPWHKDSNMLKLRESRLLDVVEKHGGRVLLPLHAGPRLQLPDATASGGQAATRSSQTRMGLPANAGGASDPGSFGSPSLVSPAEDSTPPATRQSNVLKTLTEQYKKELADALSECKGRSIGVFGIGADGHTAGMLPQDSPEKFDQLFGASRLVLDYQGPDFERITIGPTLIQQLVLPVVYAAGENKRPALEALLRGDQSQLYKYPAFVLRQLSRLFLFTDIQLD